MRIRFELLSYIDIYLWSMRKAHENRLENLRPLGFEEADTECYVSGTESCSDSHSSDSGVANWEQFVSSDGSLFYIEYYSHEIAKLNCATGGKPEYVRTSLRGGKKSSRRQVSGTGTDVFDATTPSNLLFSNVDTREQSVKTLELVITATDRYRFGRRSTAVESILGFHVKPFVDQPECLMVDGFVHDMPALFQQGNHIPIGRGDWFKSLDQIEVRTSNIDELLLQFVDPTKVCLTFHNNSILPDMEKCTMKEETDEVQIIQNYNQFINIFEKLVTLPQNTMEFGLLILPPECYQNDEYKASLYYYPEDPDNFLYKARGSFLTLNAVLTDEMKTKPFASELTYGGVEYLVFYRNINGFLVLVSFPSKLLTMPEGTLRVNDLLTYIKLMQPTMNLDSFKCSVFREFMTNFCNIQRARLILQTDPSRADFSFEESLNETRHLPLPKEAQLRIFDALSEMEAMDYRSWNDEPLHTHREFFIYGSTLYYDNLMLASQMPLDFRRYIDTYLRCRGTFDFAIKHTTKEMYIWEEIKLNDNKDRYFLAICGRGHLLLAVILKLFSSPDLEQCEKVEPSLFYIEEIQETVDHLIQCGIESLAMFWQQSNKRPEILEMIFPEDNATESPKKGDNNAHKQKTVSNVSAGAVSKDARTMSNEDDTQMCSSLGGSSVQSLTPSEDDSGKKRHAANVDDSDSGSDWENFAEDTLARYGNEFELQSNVTENLCKEISNVVPIKISSGWNNDILYFVYIDGHNNTAFGPLKRNDHSIPYSRDVYRAFHCVRNILQSSKHLRRDCQRQTYSRNQIAVKEHSMTISVKNNDASNYKFVVVGRLFLSPSKEVYICHRPNASTNMLEMAFRLSLFTTG